MGKCLSDSSVSQTRSEAIPPEEGAGPGRGAAPRRSWAKQWGLLVTVDRGVAKLEPDEKGTICTGGEVSNPSSCYGK